MHERQRKQPISTGLDTNPFIGNGLITGAYGVYRNEFRALTLQFFQTNFDGIRGMIFGHTPHHEIFGVVPIGFTKLPKRLTDRIQPPSRHVD